MLPNISPPIDRREKAMQGVQRRGPQQAYHGSVNASDSIGCTICLTACDILPWPASLACKAVCNATGACP